MPSVWLSDGGALWYMHGWWPRGISLINSTLAGPDSVGQSLDVTFWCLQELFEAASFETWRTVYSKYFLLVKRLYSKVTWGMVIQMIDRPAPHHPVFMTHDKQWTGPVHTSIMQNTWEMHCDVVIKLTKTSFVRGNFKPHSNFMTVSYALPKGLAWLIYF